MPVKLRLAIALALTSACRLALAETPCTEGELDCESQPASPSSQKQPAAPAELVNASGLVPLREWNARPYQGIWFADFRWHAYELGLSMFSLAASGTIPAQDSNAGASSSRVSMDGSSAWFVGLLGNYYIPVLGYSPNVSLGLLPEFHAQLGGIGGGSSSNDTDALSESKLGSALELPVYAMLRLGEHASRYSDWSVSLGGGVGMTLITFTTGKPIKDSATYVTPMLRLEAGYGGFKLGYESSLFAHDNFTSADAPLRVGYRAQMFTLTFLAQPDPED